MLRIKLGAFGFLASSRLAVNGGLANVGLHDQNAALSWTKAYINRLGGNPDFITVMGESAGAGSIMHHLTARGGTTIPVFKQAIIQSPGFIPQYSSHCSVALTSRYNDGQLSNQFYHFANSSGCGGLSNPLPCLRSQNTQKLQEANSIEISKAPYGQFQYGPAIDGGYVQGLPGKEILLGRYPRGIKLLNSHV